MVPNWCSLCKKMHLLTTTPSKPVVPPVLGVQHSQAPTPRPFQSHYATISTHKTRNEERYWKDRIGEQTTLVHVSGHLHLWTIEKILALAPNLKTIRVIPTALPQIGEQHRALTLARGVTITAGHDRPNATWEGENRSPTYSARRALFKTLAANQESLLNELIAFGFEEAQMTKRYFCLGNEPYISERAIAEDFEVSRSSVVSRCIRGVMHYLKLEPATSDDAIIKARGMERRVSWIRKNIDAQQGLENAKLNLAREIGIAKLPENLPPSKWEIFKNLMQAKRTGVLNALSSRRKEAVILRYGLENFQYRTFREVAPIMGVSWQAVWLYENEALDILSNIQKDT